MDRKSSPFTVVQVNDTVFHQPSKWNAIPILLGLTTLAASGFALSSTSRLWATPAALTSSQISISASILREPARIRIPTMFQVAVESDMEPSRTVSNSHTAHFQVKSLFGGLAIALATAVTLAWRMRAPKPEALALLPMTGMTEGTKALEDGAEEIFTFENLRSAPGSRHRKKRKGRGHAAGQGATCGFGTRGQKSRKGSSVRPGFEGGQNPLWRRTPKLRGRPLGPGHVRKIYQMVSIARLETCAAGSTVQYDDRSGGKPVLFKVGGLRPGVTAAIPSGLTVKAHAFSGSARSAIEAAGGKCVLIDKYSRELDAEGKVVANEKVAMAASSGQVVHHLETDVAGSILGAESMEEAVAMFATTAVRSVKVGKYKEPAPLSQKMSSSKMAIVQQVNASLKASFLVFGFGVEGYTHAQLSELRKTMPAGVKIQVVKNTLFRMASRGTGFEVLDPLSMGSKAWVFVPEACFQDAVKTYLAFVKQTRRQDKNPIVGGSCEAKLLGEPEVAALADIPSREQLMFRLVRVLRSVPSRMVRTLRRAKVPQDTELPKELPQEP